MAKRKKARVFVSYSRHDEALVKPLAGLLGVAADDAVFLDVSSLKPGDLWEKEILAAVKEASVFVLCWCCESEGSTFIAREISVALAEGQKRLVPVLFCSAPLPPSMADRQWIDLRGKVVHSCPVPHTRKPPQRSAHQSPSPVEERQQRAPDMKLHRNRQRAETFDPVDELAPRAMSPAPLPAVYAPAERGAPGLGFKQASVAAILLAGFVAGAGYFSMIHQAARDPKRTLTPSADPHSFPVLAVWATLGLIVLALAIQLLYRKLRSLRTREQQRQAERIAATARSYFQDLGRT